MKDPKTRWGVALFLGMALTMCVAASLPKYVGEFWGNGANLTNTPGGSGGGGTNTGPITLSIVGGSVTVLATTPLGCVTNAPLIYSLSLTESPTISNPSGTFGDGQRITFRLRQNATGGYTPAWGAKYTYGDDLTGVSVKTNANSVSYVAWIYDSTQDEWHCVANVIGY